jgi:hypothetical protein
LIITFGRAGGTTGEEGLYIKWNNNEIMYHVSTMLPYNPKDKQQVPSTSNALCSPQQADRLLCVRCACACAVVCVCVRSDVN